MARLALPELERPGSGRLDARAVRDHWARVLWFELCSYCLLHCDSLQLDHHEPRALARERGEESANLLPACPNCNRAKSDYHPVHGSRRRAREGRHPVHDVREDNFAALFHVFEDGSIVPRLGTLEERGAFLIALMKLDRDRPTRRRAEIVELLSLCESALMERAMVKLPAVGEAALELLLGQLARQALFLIAHDLAISPVLWSHLATAADTIARQPGSA